MDFLDPRKQRAHMIRLIVGYVLIGIAVMITTWLLVNRVHGTTFDSAGKVVQNGRVFVSSKPDNARVYLNGKLFKDTTNVQIKLPEGKYAIDVKKDGYRPWKRDVTVVGDTVGRYDYPLLIPSVLTPVPIKSYTSLPGFASQSPDRRWLLVSRPGEVLGFDMYDMSDPAKIGDNLKTVALPAGIVTADATETAAHVWKLAEWSTDNRRVILEHSYAGGSANVGGREYILLDRDEPTQSLNLTRTLDLAPGQILSLRDKKYDKYYIYDPAARTVGTATINEPAIVPVLTGVLAFKSYSDDILLYATESGASAVGKIMTMLRDGDVTYKIQEIGSGAPYLLDLSRYDGNWHVAVGASGDNKAYVFRNPQSVRKAGKVKNLVPVQVLRVTAPNYLAFSSNTRFVMIENSTSFAVYDAETDEGYTYASMPPMDGGPGSDGLPAHAIWIDGHRLTYVSGGKTIIFDYDNINTQTLVPASPAFLPFFDRDYENLYSLTPPAAATGQSVFTATSLLTEADR